MTACKALTCAVNAVRPFLVRLYHETGFRFSNLLIDAHVTRVFQFSQVRAHVAVGFFQQLLQAAEVEGVNVGEEHARAKAGPVFKQFIQFAQGCWLWFQSALSSRGVIHIALTIRLAAMASPTMVQG